MNDFSSAINEFSLDIPNIMKSLRIAQGYDLFYHESTDNEYSWHYLTIVTNEKGHAEELKNAGLMIIYRSEGQLGVYGLAINPVNNDVEQVMVHDNPLEFMLRIDFKDRNNSFEFEFEESENLGSGSDFKRVNLFFEEWFVKEVYNLIKGELSLPENEVDSALTFENLYKEVNEKLDEPYYKKTLKEFEAEGLIPKGDVPKTKKDNSFKEWLGILRGNNDWHKIN